MKPVTKTILKSFDKAYKILPVSRPEIETFKANYIQLMDRVNESENNNESEENFKGHLMDFLKKTYYQKPTDSASRLVAPKGKTDFVIHTTNDGSSPAAILFEVKRPKNITEMVSRENLNTKAMQELMLYYFEERSKHQNNDITHLVITNIYEWYIFESNTFERLFYKNSKLLKEFKDWKDGKKVSRNNDLFYNEIAKPALDDIDESIEFTYFDIRTYEKNIRNNKLEDDGAIIGLYKIFSPTHLLKLQATNDNNKLNNKFYTELLHIIGLEEVKDGGKKLIQRKEQGKRDEGSLLENCINIIENEDRLHHVNDLFAYGKGKDEQHFNIGLELCITWINRILFLKLLEAQLQKYHNNDQSYRFLNSQTIPNFDVLNKLFFQVLAKPINQRSESVQAQFSRIPYLNSSLFDISALEDDTIRISNLDDSLDIELLRSSVLRNNAAHTNKKQISTLHYLFAFLDAYDFASENKEDIIEENRELISASVLGLIFEKINGYRDGSFYTPAFITEYMCKETITKAVIQKFNETKSWNCDSLIDLHNKIDDIKEANLVFDSLHICDPAVGSGHFLVSALNALIFIKAEIGILQDRNGKRLKGYHIEVINDELLVLDEEEKVFEYKVLPNGKVNTEIQRVQETLFHEKQTLIENCLFGVDINPNSVKICRLRLWIELLKNAYYINPSPTLPNRDIAAQLVGLELQTLPNIDINIKQGNSLLSRFALNEDLSDVFQKQRFSLQIYRDAVQAYKDSKGKDAKAKLLQFINEIKEQFRETVYLKDPRRKKLTTLKEKRLLLDYNVDMFGNVKIEKDQADLQKRKLDAEIKKTEAEITDIEQNNTYKGSFEWRFEFPEVLDDKGDFVGFDVVIGNPPYVRSRDNFGIIEKKYYAQRFKTLSYQADLYKLFIELSTDIIASNGLISLITPSVFLTNDYDKPLREFLLNGYSFTYFTKPNGNIFEEASVVVTVFLLESKKENSKINILEIFDNHFYSLLSQEQEYYINNDYLINSNFDNINLNLLQKIAKHPNLEVVFEVKNGIKVRKDLLKSIKVDLKHKPFILGRHVKPYVLIESGEFVHYTKENENLYTNQAFRTPDIFEQPKLIVRQIPANRLIVSFDNENIYTDQTTYVINHPLKDTKKLKLLLAILSSKLMFFYFANTMADNKDIFPKIKRSNLLLLPIPEISESAQAPIIAKVEQILAIKNRSVEPFDPATDTTQLEAEIDAMVYQLYDLTPEEIAIVEGK